jgi:hypothetical protein
MFQDNSDVFRLLVVDVPLEGRNGMDTAANSFEKVKNKSQIISESCKAIRIVSNLLGFVHEGSHTIIASQTILIIGQSTAFVNGHGHDSATAVVAHLSIGAVVLVHRE